MKIVATSNQKVHVAEMFVAENVMPHFAHKICAAYNEKYVTQFSHFKMECVKDEYVLNSKLE